MRPIDENRFPLLLFFAIFLFLVTFSSGHLYTMDDHTNFHVLESLWERGTAAVETSRETRHLNLVTGADGRRYSYYGPGGPVAYLPFFAIGRSVGELVGKEHFLSMSMMSLTNSFFTAVAAAFLYLFLIGLNFSRKTALVSTVIYIAATPLLVWARHSTNTVLVASLFVVTAHLLRQDRIRPAATAGILLGFALTIRYDAVIGVALILAGALLLKPKSWLSLSAAVPGILAGLIAIALYNEYRFGSPFELGYPDLQTGDQFGNPIGAGLYSLFLSPNAGLFFYAPVLFLSLPGIVAWKRRNPRALLLILGLPTVYALFYARLQTWHGGIGWSVRYLAPVVPFLVVLTAAALERCRSRGFRILTVALITVSVLIQIWGTIVNIDSYHDHLVEKQIGPLVATHEPAYSPLWGSVEVARNFTLDRPADVDPNVPLPAGGYPATRNLRHTPDYWPFYAYKIGVPAPIAARLWSGLFILTLAAGIVAGKAFSKTTSTI